MEDDSGCTRCKSKWPECHCAYFTADGYWGLHSNLLETTSTIDESCSLACTFYGSNPFLLPPVLTSTMKTGWFTSVKRQEIQKLESCCILLPFRTLSPPLFSCALVREFLFFYKFNFKLRSCDRALGKREQISSLGRDSEQLFTNTLLRYNLSGYSTIVPHYLVLDSSAYKGPAARKVFTCPVETKCPFRVEIGPDRGNSSLKQTQILTRLHRKKHRQTARSHYPMSSKRDLSIGPPRGASRSNQ